MSSAAAQAAAGLVPGMVNDLVEAMPLAGDDQLRADLQATQPAAAAPEQVSSSQPQTAPAAAQATAAAPVQDEPVVEEEFDLEPVISDELRELLEEPDFDEEARAEVQAQIDDGEIDYSTDPEIAQRLKALEKRNAWLEEQRVRTESKRWVRENLDAYPLLKRYAAEEVGAITATSRRAFAREAKALNDRLAKMVKPALEDIEAAKKQLRGEVSQEVRAEYKEGWGEITTGPGVAPVEASAQEAEYTAAMKTGNLAKVIGVMMKAAGVNQQ